MGQYELAMQSYLQSIRIAEATANQEYLAYNYGSIGGLQDKQHNYADAEKYYQLALDLFIKQNDWYGRMSVYNNMGILYKNEKQYKKALEAYDQCLAVADSMQYGRGKQSAHTNIGILNCLMGNFENGYQHNETGLELATSFGDQESVSDNLNWMARAQMGLQDYTRALKNATQSLEIALQVQSLEKQQDANLTLSEIYQHLHEYALSLDYYKAYTLAKDSLYNLDKLKQIEELQTAYQTEKKDKEIQLLGKNLEINRIRRTRLWVAFGLSILVGGLLIYNQWLRRTRDKKILSQEKQLEIHRRQTAELETEKVSRELDFKKQELAAKALQLARKNEFLQTLQSQVETLPVSSDGSSVDAVRKISRSIRMDIESEEDWDHFLSSFREVHRDYIEQLQQQYPDLTTSEIRLACLMKMNLSGKELAALLNVSADGIKKARYRLRKKLNLDSEIDIQAYLLSFPS
jgi:tetratricopeptide (TPR) repeat protein